MEIPEITNVIINDTNKLNIIGSKRECGLDNILTIFRANGTTISKTGKQIGQLVPHALIQDVKMPSENERALNVEMPETMHDIVSDTTRLNIIGAERDGSFMFTVRPTFVNLPKGQLAIRYKITSDLRATV